MAKFKRHLPMSATIAIVVHVAIILLLVVGFKFKSDRKANPLDNINTINATVISSEKFDDKKLSKESEQQKKQQEIKQKLEEEKKLFMESPEGKAYNKRLNAIYQKDYRSKNKESIRKYQKEYHLHYGTF